MVYLVIYLVIAILLLNRQFVCTYLDENDVFWSNRVEAVAKECNSYYEGNEGETKAQLLEYKVTKQTVFVLMLLWPITYLLRWSLEIQDLVNKRKA